MVRGVLGWVGVIPFGQPQMSDGEESVAEVPLTTCLRLPVSSLSNSASLNDYSYNKIYTIGHHWIHWNWAMNHIELITVTNLGWCRKTWKLEAFDLRRMMASENLQPEPPRSSPRPQSSAIPPVSSTKSVVPKAGAPAASSATAQV